MLVLRQVRREIEAKEDAEWCTSNPNRMTEAQALETLNSMPGMKRSASEMEMEAEIQ